MRATAPDAVSRSATCSITASAAPDRRFGLYRRQGRPMRAAVVGLAASIAIAAVADTPLRLRQGQRVRRLTPALELPRAAEAAGRHRRAARLRPRCHRRRGARRRRDLVAVRRARTRGGARAGPGALGGREPVRERDLAAASPATRRRQRFVDRRGTCGARVRNRNGPRPVERTDRAALLETLDQA